MRFRPEAKVFRDLPDSPGVYLFYARDGQLLYVGKSVTVRTRVRSHFAAPEESRMCGQVTRIEVKPTAGELGALLLESQLIKELRPFYNVMSREKRRILIARKQTTVDGYSGIALEAVDRIDPSNTSPIMSIFKTRTQAKEYLSDISKAHHLCAKLLGLERTSRHCFPYHLGQCKGACVGEEEPAAYNARLEMAFEDRRIKAWPFAGSVLIEERAPNNNEGEVFVIDHWCLLYSFRYSLNRYDLQVQGSYRFDYDSYKILSRYIFDESHSDSIRDLISHEIERMLYVSENSSIAPRPAICLDLQTG